MGYQVYKISEGRWGGYGVPATCEQPECNEEIDRGMDCACGGEPFSEIGCDGYFCEKHLFYCQKNTGYGERAVVQLCNRCKNYKSRFPYKPETELWVKHLLNDPSWAEWRKKNKREVKRLQITLKN